MPLALDEEQQDLVLRELAALGPDLSDPAAQARLQALAAAVRAGTVAEEELDTLGALLEVSLQSGHARRLHRADGEQALVQLFAGTPHGAALAAAVRDVNRALAQLAGQPLESARLSSSVPGVYSLVLSTNRLQLTLRLEPAAPRVQSVEVGL